MTEQRIISTRTWAELFLLGFIWGGSFLAIRLALNEVPFVTSVAHRVFWAALILWGYVALRGLPIPRDPKIWGALFVMGLLNNVIPFSLMAWGQLYIPTGLTSVFNAGTAIFGVIIAALILADERLTTRKVLGSLIGFFGVATAIGLESVRNFDITSLAQLAVIGGTISYAFAGVWARINLKDLTPQVAAAGMLTGSSILMVPAAYLIDGTPSFDLSLTAIGAIAYYVVFATAGAYLLYYRILAAAGSANTMIVTLLIPPVSIVLGALVLSESLSPNVYAGLALLALGLAILDGRLFKR
ncbi:Permease of the drug/metabolite transporter (DMT) superfamily [Octadecabacter temperatus]|uniref:Putative DMT superfamily transporter inner membrane protein n=1 Tax=Octadecabacter temperatus TaxID=1458307 RepID=A0A0K0Y704_9RHOB|nr:DMT family transporter [Octadecabacter temperatus]AKS46734.1 putative DMT superfamily transporter inner membrane protein [Octadecabacter temperatus]SIO20227.1 Permease of the drug/metabolite transporter (DMT) superfamily [Octadecabacter temperatus]